jgi:hypothetical protein
LTRFSTSTLRRNGQREADGSDSAANLSGISTQYQDRAHDIKILFYSSGGPSIEMTDTVEYDVQFLDHGTVKAAQSVISHYVIVLTPAEVQWRVRVFQAEPD